MRDYALGTTFDVKFSTRSFTTGAPTTLAGSPAVAAYPDNSTTEITAGITLTVDFDARTGLHNVRVVGTSGNGYASGSNYALVLTAGTVGGVSVVGEVIGEFSLEAQSPLRPATAGSTLTVTSGRANADVTHIATAAVSTSTAQLGVNVVNFGGSAGTFASGRPEVNTTHAAGTAWGSGAITAASIATDAITAAKIAADAIGASELAADAVTEIQSGLATPASILTTALTESYSTDGSTATLTQLLYAIQQFLQERAVSGTTLTVKKLDGSTTAMTFTLNDATTPTSITRTT